MRIQVLSDLFHDLYAENDPGKVPISVAAGVDVLVIAGNAGLGGSGIELYRSASVPVVYVHGSHEARNGALDELLRLLKVRASGSPVRFLERSVVDLVGVRFIGCCLWTNFAASPYPAHIAMREGDRFLSDFRLISLHGTRFDAQSAVVAHRDTLHWLERELSRREADKKVVVTHFAPCVLSIPEGMRQDALAATIASDLGTLLQQADVWVHGRVHDTFDYRVGSTRVVCNGRGYPWEQGEMRGRRCEFEPSFVIDI